MHYEIGVHKLKPDEFFYPVGEPNDYFNYYNKKAPIEKHSLHEICGQGILSNYDDYFSFKYSNKDDKIVLSNNLFILLSGTTDVGLNLFTTGLEKEITFLESGFYMLVKVNTSIFSPIDLECYTRGWLIGDFVPSIERQTEFEVGCLSHSQHSFWNYHYHKESVEINYLLRGKMLINNVEYNKSDVFIINKNVISCPLFLEDSEVICIKLPSIPKDKYLL
jgi:hypothetical protein